MLSSIILPLTTSLPVVLGIPGFDNHNSSYSRLESYIPFMIIVTFTGT